MQTRHRDEMENEKNFRETKSFLSSLFLGLSFILTALVPSSNHKKIQKFDLLAFGVRGEIVVT